MVKVKSVLHVIGHAAGVVAHDPAVESAAKHTAAVVILRGALAVGASAGVVEVIRAMLAHVGVV